MTTATVIVFLWGVLTGMAIALWVTVLALALGRRKYNGPREPDRGMIPLHHLSKIRIDRDKQEP